MNIAFAVRIGEYLDMNGETTLTIGTTNPAKVAQIAGALASLGVTVRGIEAGETLPVVLEDGETVQENARKKATAYAKTLGRRVLSMDNALYLEGLSPEEQPGIHVRRIGGAMRNTDEELLAHYEEVIKKLGERVNGRWEFGVCVADPDGHTWEIIIISPRIFTSMRSSKVVVGYPLESLQIDPESGRYVSELGEEERAEFWQHMIGDELMKFMLTIV
jgi:XTP/dITP diphosphohydrolase